MIKASARSRAFTLVETIFSTLFISLTVLAIVNLFPGAYLSVKRSETQLQADNIAKSIIEEIRSMEHKTIVDLEKNGEIHSTRPKREGPEDQREGEPIKIHGAPFDAARIDGIGYVPKVFLYKVDSTVSADQMMGVIVEVAYQVGVSRRESVYETYIHSIAR